MANNSYIRVPPDGAGKSVMTTEYTISGNTVQVQGIQVVDHDNPTYKNKIDSKGGLYTRFTDGDPILTPRSVQKVAEEYVIGIYDHTIDNYDDLFSTVLISGGTSTFQPEYSSMKLSVSEVANSSVKRTTNRYHYYHPAHTMLINLVCSCGDIGKTNNIRRWGYFDDQDGFYFELNGETLNIVRRSDGVEQDVIPQNEWSDDKLDGNGDSNLIIDVRDAHQYWIGVNWPVGLIQFGVYYNGFRVLCHKIEDAATTPAPVISNMSLPIRFENKNTSLTSGVSDFRAISAFVKSEDLEPNYTYWRFADLGVENKTVTTNTPILSVRPKTNLDNGLSNTINSYPETLSVFSSGASLKVMLVWNDCGDILTGATWTLDSIDGPLEADNTATEINVDADDYWLTKVYYVQQGVPTDIDLSPIFELNDEGVLLSRDSSDNPKQAGLSFVGTILDGTSASVTMDLSYRGLY